MNINRHNYEEYFILYMDNELSHDEKKMVDLFVQQNTDLEEELTMLLQSKLIVDGSVRFDEKESLLRTESGLSISTELLLRYADNELSAAEQQKAERLITENPSVKTEWDYLQKVKLEPEENIVFPDKSILYRKEEPGKIVYFNWRRIAVAAALLLAVSTAAFIIFSDKKQNSSIASDTPGRSVIPSEKTETTVLPKEENVLAETPLEEKATVIKEELASQKENRQAIKNKPAAIIKENTGTSLAVEAQDDKNRNNLPAPTYNPNMQRPIESTNNLAELNMPEKKALTIPEEKISIQPVTPSYAHSLQSSNELIDVEQPEKKNALRGLLRKVTRTFEKTTNIKATDDEDRLLVAGLAIKL